MEKLKERKEIIKRNYEQIKKYEDELNIRKQRDAKELSKLHQIIDDVGLGKGVDV